MRHVCLKVGRQGFDIQMQWRTKSVQDFIQTKLFKWVLLKHLMAACIFTSVIKPQMTVGHIKSQIFFCEWLKNFWQSTINLNLQHTELKMTLWSLVRAWSSLLIHMSLFYWLGCLLLVVLACPHGNSSCSSGSASIFDCRPVGSLGCDKRRPQG